MFPNALLLLLVTNGGRSSHKSHLKPAPSLISRRDLVEKAIVSTLCAGVLDAQPALSSNLPPPNGADLSKTGTVEKLIPILRIQDSLWRAEKIIMAQSASSVTISPSLLQEVSIIFQDIPKNERAFKRLFDEYSDPVSYKQKYLDQNAFLVYYTKGFDGPNRDSIESGEVSKQTIQYGARNECWNAFEELNAEIIFGISNRSAESGDIIPPLIKAVASLDAYLSLAPTDQVEQAKSQVKKNHGSSLIMQTFFLLN